MHLPRFLPLTLAVTLIAAAPAAQAQEDWRLSHGAFTTGADVRPHNGLPQDRGDMLAALAQTPPDWAEALTVYTWGRNFPWRDMTHSLGRFADDYNGAMPSVLPASVAHWNNPSFAVAPVYSALAGTGTFAGQSPAARIAFVDGATLATIINWTRFELATSQRKALAATPNWALTNGSPKNWNEIFAFHIGPEAQHSVHAALEAVPDGAAVNTRLYETLAAGQEELLAQQWPADAAAEVGRILDAGALHLFHAALGAAAAAPDDATRGTAMMHAQGLWLAAAEPVLSRMPDAVGAIEAALAGSGGPASLAAAMDAVARTLDRIAG